MTGSISKAITLTTYGNAYLKGNFDISKLTLDHPSFTFTNTIEFLIFKKHFFRKPTWDLYANSPIDWLIKLKQTGCKEIRMVFETDNTTSLNGENIPDYKLAGFVGGGGKRYIETVFDKHSDFWQSREEVTNQNAKDKKIWKISYGRLIINQPTQSKTEYDLEYIKNELNQKLIEIGSFAKKEKLDFWANWFNEAIDILNKNYPYTNEHDKLIVPTEKMELESLQLLAGAGKAWCFGGMGSWNDNGFNEKDKHKTYERLTSELYEIVNLSYLAVANTNNYKT
ncbi:hypothetical protein [Psychroserpens ponticola]|uniref:Uncharacterized protein n=1 Tax=Psychroserpens ponticola TaxID=2932268 RepID=A0ABY7RSX3_9FLAO|nr:hypothetical protein [Psychroserpens ponticola]WCO00232.1 hypothetical protein MUN68_009105 [Psychroserpens ponticola]